MHARVTQVRILSGKMEEFREAVDSLVPAIRRQAGFRALLVLGTTPGPAPEAMVVSIWDSLDKLKESEKNLFLYQALSRVLGFCDGFPLIREREVLVSEFAAGAKPEAPGRG